MFYGVFSEELAIPDNLYPTPLTRLDTPFPETQRPPDREDHSGIEIYDEELLQIRVNHFAVNQWVI